MLEISFLISRCTFKNYINVLKEISNSISSFYKILKNEDPDYAKKMQHYIFLINRHISLNFLLEGFLLPNFSSGIFKVNKMSFLKYHWTRLYT